MGKALSCGIRRGATRIRGSTRRIACGHSGVRQHVRRWQPVLKGTLTFLPIPFMHVRLLVEQMTAVGFEPTQLALVELESTPLDHSGKLSLPQRAVAHIPWRHDCSCCVVALWPRTPFLSQSENCSPHHPHHAHRNQTHNHSTQVCQLRYAGWRTRVHDTGSGTRVGYHGACCANVNSAIVLWPVSKIKENKTSASCVTVAHALVHWRVDTREHIR